MGLNPAGPGRAERWRAVRADLNRRRHELGLAAAELYPGVPRVEGTTLLHRPEWLPAAPVPLADVRLGWDARPGPPAVTGAGPELTAGLESYSAALAALAPSAVFENRPAYRLLGADLAGERVLRFGPARYFDGVDVGEALGHELAAGGTALRGAVGAPGDLSRRPALPAITVLTVRAGAVPEFVLHWRDPAKVVHAGGLHQVMPVGVFQQVADERADLDPWRCMVREYAEEFLGAPEEYGPNFDQESWPFHRRLTEARRAGLIRVHWLGLGADPLTLSVDLLVVAVFDPEVFDAEFGGLVETNDEGRVSRVPFPPEPAAVEPMQPAGAAVLALARRHRTALGL
ncbi:hypothetical protein [Actinomadura craniellae]|uniref:hypothetical protein n=1 Tax=Actinomadura craniellae TaxID=2231787 RepID=UPI0018F12177|nr:hypothetical protein [Actinomadura craniellae]